MLRRNTVKVQTEILGKSSRSRMNKSNSGDPRGCSHVKVEAPPLPHVPGRNDASGLKLLVRFCTAVQGQAVAYLTLLFAPNGWLVCARS